MLPLHLRINDAGYKVPTPVRLRITGPAGEYFAPLGRLAVFSVGKGEAVGGNVRINKENWAYIDGQCEIRLPSGVPLRVQAWAGPCHRPLDTTVTLGPGQLSLRFEIEPLHYGHFFVDYRAHFLDNETTRLEADAEDVSVVQMQAFVHSYLGHDGNTYETIPNIAAFSGQKELANNDLAPFPLIYVNTLNQHTALGRVALLNCHRPIHPLAFGGHFCSDDWSLLDWCRQCHRKNGLTVWVDAFRPDAGLPGGEALVAAVLGQIDVIEIDAQPRKEPLLPWIYRLWNAGFPIPIVGSSGKASNGTALGAMRTGFVENHPYDEAVRHGRMYVTNGPLVELSVDGHGPGRDMKLNQAGCKVTVKAQAKSVTPFERLEVVENGQVIASATPSELAATISMSHFVQHSGWLAARVIGPDTAFAHTSPIKVDVPGVPFPHRRMFLPLLRQCVEGVKEWAIERGVYTEEKWRTQLVANCDTAIEKLTVSAPRA